jgi:hypothetical protein
MGVYADFVHPKLYHLVKHNKRFVPYRERMSARHEGMCLKPE